LHLQDAEAAALERQSFAPSIEMAEALERAGKLDSAFEVYDSLFRRSLPTGDLARSLMAVRRAGRIRISQARYEEAEELALLSWEIAERGTLPNALASAMNLTAIVYAAQAKLDLAQPIYENALNLARELRDDLLIGLVTQNLGVIANMRGQFSAARTWYLESVGSAVRSGDQGMAVMAYNNLGMVSSDLREWMESEMYFTRGIEIAEQIGDSALLAKLYANRAEPLINVGDLESALDTLSKAEAVAKEVGLPKANAGIARFRAAIARRKGDTKTASRFLSESLVIAAKAGLHLERAEALEELARVRWQEGKGDEATATAREARQVYASLGAEKDSNRVEELLDQWETEQFVAGWSVD
jgi:tetratricopeptide (TPR) repeat protein